MKKIYKYKSTIPYSLHDMRIYKIEVVDEMYGCNQVNYSGYLSVPGIEDIAMTQYVLIERNSLFF